MRRLHGKKSGVTPAETAAEPAVITVDLGALSTKVLTELRSGNGALATKIKATIEEALTSVGSERQAVPDIDVIPILLLYETLTHS